MPLAAVCQVDLALRDNPVNFSSTYPNHTLPVWLKGHYRNRTESLAKAGMNKIHCSPVYRRTYDKRQSVMHGSHLANPPPLFLTSSLSFICLEMVSRKIFSIVFLKT